jgi:hypothetical protein
MMRGPVEKNTVIGITQSKMYNSIIPRRKAQSIAQGKAHGGVELDHSFKGYEVVLLEQDEPKTIQTLIDAVLETDCSHSVLKNDFINP